MYEIDYASKYIETLDNWRESHEKTEELKNFLVETNEALTSANKTLTKTANVYFTAGERLKIAASELEKYKDNPDRIGEFVLVLEMLGEAFILNHNDIKAKI